jgi:hypothetical protein
LKSLHAFFERARDITAAHLGCRIIDTLAWHVINTYVRPFTAKWHPQSERGALAALDATDVFRAELIGVQRALSCFDDLLIEILRHIRHFSKYLATGSLWERTQMVTAQLYGMALNGLGMAYLAVCAALVELFLRSIFQVPHGWAYLVAFFASVLAMAQAGLEGRDRYRVIARLGEALRLVGERWPKSKVLLIESTQVLRKASRVCLGPTCPSKGRNYRIV